jgi:hypothetical protein
MVVDAVEISGYGVDHDQPAVAQPDGRGRDRGDIGT